jgi:very-short-patch-repair endonuclease
VVVGQKVQEAKVIRAREMRREMTPEEKILWESLRANRLGGLRFRRQQIIDGFIVDFYCHAAGLVVEVDSAAHEENADYDRERDRILTARGVRVLRIPNHEVRNNLLGVIELITTACRQQS